MFDLTQIKVPSFEYVFILELNCTKNYNREMNKKYTEEVEEKKFKPINVTLIRHYGTIIL